MSGSGIEDPFVGQVTEDQPPSGNSVEIPDLRDLVMIGLMAAVAAMGMFVRRVYYSRCNNIGLGCLRVGGVEVLFRRGSTNPPSPSRLVKIGENIKIAFRSTDRKSVV